jgi:hypothetical protein
LSFAESATCTGLEGKPDTPDSREHFTRAFANSRALR